MTSLLLAGLRQLFCFLSFATTRLQRKGLVYQIDKV